MSDDVAFSPDGKTIAAGYHVGIGLRGWCAPWNVAARAHSDEPLPVRGGPRQVRRGLQPRRQDHRRRIRPASACVGVVLWDVATRQAPDRKTPSP